jgi:hypothetical protein
MMKLRKMRAQTNVLILLLVATAGADERVDLVRRLEQQTENGYALEYIHRQTVPSRTWRVRSAWQGVREVSERQELTTKGTVDETAPRTTYITTPDQTLAKSPMPGSPATGPIEGAVRDRPKSPEMVRPMFDRFEGRTLAEWARTATTYERTGDGWRLADKLRGGVSVTMDLQDHGSEITTTRIRLDIPDGSWSEYRLETPGPISAKSEISQTSALGNSPERIRSTFTIRQLERKPLPPEATSTALPAYSRLTDVREGVHYRVRSDGSLGRTNVTQDRKRWEGWRYWGWWMLVGAAVAAFAIYRIWLKPSRNR